MVTIINNTIDHYKLSASIDTERCEGTCKIINNLRLCLYIVASKNKTCIVLPASTNKQYPACSCMFYWTRAVATEIFSSYCSLTLILFTFCDWIAPYKTSVLLVYTLTPWHSVHNFSKHQTVISSTVTPSETNTKCTGMLYHMYQDATNPTVNLPSQDVHVYRQIEWQVDRQTD
jgi:hypothetical protein